VFPAQLRDSEHTATPDEPSQLRWSDAGPAETFNEFCFLLSRWTEDALSRNELASLSEDTICFFLAEAFVRCGADAHRIEMEVPHPALTPNAGAQKDVDIRVGGKGDCWIEVKLDKKIPSGKSLNKTNRLGGLVNDMLRMGILRTGRGFVAYVTDEVMAQCIEENRPRLLSGPVFTLDQDFLGTLPPAAAKKVDPRVERTQPPGGVLVSILCKQRVAHWMCLLYAISP
jgi:hypothetical protein